MSCILEITEKIRDKFTWLEIRSLSRHYPGAYLENWVPTVQFRSSGRNSSFSCLSHVSGSPWWTPLGPGRRPAGGLSWSSSWWFSSSRDAVLSVLHHALSGSWNSAAPSSTVAHFFWFFSFSSHCSQPCRSPHWSTRRWRCRSTVPGSFQAVSGRTCRRFGVVHTENSDPAIYWAAPRTSDSIDMIDHLETRICRAEGFLLSSYPGV